VHTKGVARVIAGEAGGRRLAVPDGRDTRPTSDRAREGLFATISSVVGSLAGVRVLDLYAGSGAVGLEALSRGAGHVLLVESDVRAGRVIRENIEAIGLAGAEVVTDRVERVLARGPAPSAAGSRYDIVFADPPYALPGEDVSRMLALLAGGDDPPRPPRAGIAGGDDPSRPPRAGIAGGDDPSRPPRAGIAGGDDHRGGVADRAWLAPGALVIVERATRTGPVRWPEGFLPDRARRYGEATFWYGFGPA
jgi:16S rRNA (guanine966-N2)-methyltransferase